VMKSIVIKCGCGMINSSSSSSNNNNKKFATNFRMRMVVSSRKKTEPESW